VTLTDFEPSGGSEPAAVGASWHTGRGRPLAPIDPRAPAAEFATALRALRDESGLSLRELARRMSTRPSPSLLSRIQSGDVVPRWEHVEAFVRACRVRDEASLTRWQQLWMEADSSARSRRAEAGKRPSLPAAAPEYLARLRARYQRLAIEPLIPSTEDVDMAVGLPAVFVPQLVRKIDAAPGSGLVPALTALADRDCQRLVLLGAPGAGKSTLLRYLVVTMTEEAAPGPLAGLLPVLVELRAYADPRWGAGTFLDMIHHWYVTEGLGLPRASLEAYLRDGGPAVVMFDGLDEILDSQFRETTAHQIAAFAARYPDTRIVVTSRIAGYRPQVLEAAGFVHHLIEEFDDVRIEELAGRLLAADHRGGQGTAGDIRRLMSTVLGSSEVRELARNPMLLTMLVAVGSRRGTLPQNRATLFRDILMLLLEQWDLNKHLPTAALDRAGKLELLRLAAHDMQNPAAVPSRNDISEDELLRRWENHLRSRYDVPAYQAASMARELITQLVERNFILRQVADGRYGFVHRAILEWFASQQPPSDPVPARTARGIADLLISLENINQACLRIGSTFIVKYVGVDGPVLLIRELSEPEIHALDTFPEIQADPREAMRALAEAVARSDGDGRP
jgi:transcriptional regulator with XRE-family HTH domain/energy-coupling factor transporter ATP-binding protein EcfA2